MSDLVHYLVRDPSGQFGLIYPNELNDERYVGFGSFYLLGRPGTSIGERYSFHAIRGEQTVQAELRPFRGSRSFFQAEVPGINSFVFYAQPLRPSPPYTGATTSNANLVALRRLRSWQPLELDRACREHEFYFVGYSPRIG